MLPNFNKIITIFQLFRFCRFNDVWILDLISHTWQQLEIDGVKPAPRGGHSQVDTKQTSNFNLQFL